MFIISHNDHIVCHNPLFFSVIMCVITLRHIIIYRKDQIVHPAQHRKLPDKLNVMISDIRRYLFKIHVNSVNSILKCCIYQLILQILSA